MSLAPFLKLLQGSKQDRVRAEVREAYPDRAAIAHRLTLAREFAGLTMRQAVRVTGIPYRCLEMSEAGHHCLSIMDLEQLCECYDVSVDWILGRVPEQADLSTLEPELKAYGEKLGAEHRFRFLTLLAINREVSCG